MGGASALPARFQQKSTAVVAPRYSQPGRTGSGGAMKRNKRASLPVSPVTPAAVRRRTNSARESEALLLGSSASDASSKGDPPRLPERKAASAAAGEGRPSTSSRPAGSDLRAAHALASLPAARVDGGPGGARSLAVHAGAMLGVFRSIPTQMDYKGQKLAEQIFQGIILFSAVVGFIYGYIIEQFGWTVYIVMAGFALSCLLTLPPWPIYRRNPLKWLPVQESITDEKKPADRKVKRHPKN